MLHLTAESRILIASKPVDFRKRIDGLVRVCELHLKQDPRAGSLFVFINRSRTMIRVLNYDSNGYWLATKRLSRGRYEHWPKLEEDSAISAASFLRKILKNDFT